MANNETYRRRAVRVSVSCGAAVRVLLLSAYDAESHRRWRLTISALFSHYDWTHLTLAPRYFSWRSRGNSLSWAFGHRAQLEQGYDLVIATSMVDLSALRGFVPALARIPTLVYFHENQFAYPGSGGQHASVEPQILNLYTALAGDRVIFNSAFNRDTFLHGVAALLAKMPDQVPPTIVEQLRQKSAVVPVPIEDSAFAAATETIDSELVALWHNRWTPAAKLKIVWAARWEYDKGPEGLLAILQCLERRGVDYRIAIVGQQFRRCPEAFSTIEAQFKSCLAHFGYIDSAVEYRACLASADIVLSTALHEFQGLSVIEAMAAGCVPVLPNRQVYPELVPASYLYASSPDNLAAEAEAAVDLIEAYCPQRSKVPAAGLFSAALLKPRYHQAFVDTIEAQR